MRDMWRSGDNARETLKQVLSSGEVRWASVDSNIAYGDEELELFLKSLSGCKMKNVPAHEDHLNDMIDNYSLDDDEVDDTYSDHIVVAMGDHTGLRLITSSDTAGGRDRLQIATATNADAICWKKEYDI